MLHVQTANKPSTRPGKMWWFLIVPTDLCKSKVWPTMCIWNAREFLLEVQTSEEVGRFKACGGNMAPLCSQVVGYIRNEPVRPTIPHSGGLLELQLTYKTSYKPQDIMQPIANRELSHGSRPSGGISYHQVWRLIGGIPSFLQKSSHES